MGSRVLSHGTILYRMQFLLQAGIVKTPPRWVAVVEAFPPLPMPLVSGTRTKEIVYKEEDKYRKKLQESTKKPRVLSLFEAYDITGMPENNPVDAADVTVIDVKDSEDDGIKQEQSEELGHKSTLEIIDDLKPATEGSTDNDVEGIRKSKISKSSLMAGDKDKANDIGDIFDSLEVSSGKS